MSAGSRAPPWKTSRRRRTSAVRSCTTTSPTRTSSCKRSSTTRVDNIVTRNRHELGSANGIEAWRNMVITAARRTKAKGGCALGSLVGQLAESDPEAERSSLQGSISGQPPSAMDSDPFMPTGNSRPTSTRTTSPPLCSPPRRRTSTRPGTSEYPSNRNCGRTSSPLPSADEPRGDVAHEAPARRPLDLHRIRADSERMDDRVRRRYLAVPRALADAWTESAGAQGPSGCHLYRRDWASVSVATGAAR